MPRGLHDARRGTSIFLPDPTCRNASTTAARTLSSNSGLVPHARRVLENDFQVVTSADRSLFATGLLTALYRLVLKVAEQLQGNVAFAEIFAPIQDILRQVQYPMLDEVACTAFVYHK